MDITLFKNLDHIRPDDLPKPVITIGNFDGLHLGHKKIISEVIREAERINGTPVLITFNPHPLKFFKGKHDHLITTLEQKVSLIKKEGISHVICLEFGKELAGHSPDDFIRNFIDKPFKPQQIFVGHDFNFGKGRTGTPEYLKSLEQTFRFRVNIIDEIVQDGIRISSSAIRHFLEAGDICKANSLLGHDYFLTGSVTKGKGLGRTIGFPTANIKPENELVPGNGVYCGYSFLNGTREKAVINIGVRPTMETKGERTVEAHYPNLEAGTDLYGKQVDLYFETKLRDERKFSGVDDLKKQIRKDIEAAEG